MAKKLWLQDLLKFTDNSNCLYELTIGWFCTVGTVPKKDGSLNCSDWNSEMICSFSTILQLSCPEKVAKHFLFSASD